VQVGEHGHSQASHLDFRQGQSPVTVTSSQSFFGRLKDSITGFVIGIIMLVFSFPVLWFNESRAARMESLLSIGRSQARSVTGAVSDQDSRNWLVHLNGEPMKSAAKVSDDRFDASFADDCVRLRSSVEVFQVIEHEEKKEREKFGGGKETVTTFRYSEQWSSQWHDSSTYNERSRQNSKPSGLELGTKVKECGRVEYGGGFLLSAELVQQCDDFKPAQERLGAKARLLKGSCEFSLSPDGYYYHRVGGQQGRDVPAQVGDARVKLEYVPDGPATVLALQVESSELRDTFMPYRLIGRGWCGMTEDMEKLALRKEASKSTEELVEEARCTGCLACVCCACNLVNTFFSSFLNPEIYCLFHGSLDLDSSFAVITSGAKAMAWLLRLVGWVLMFAGLYLLFSPFLTLITIIPLLGPILAKLGGFLIWIICFILTLALSSVVVMIAYAFYRPLRTILFGFLTAAIILVPILIIKAI